MYGNAGSTCFWPPPDTGEELRMSLLAHRLHYAYGAADETDSAQWEGHDSAHLCNGCSAGLRSLSFRSGKWVRY
jgi:hypothetical protein